MDLRHTRARELDGGWRLEVGGWRLEVGGWRLELNNWVRKRYVAIMKSKGRGI